MSLAEANPNISKTEVSVFIESTKQKLKRKSIVLEEDEYIDTMHHIIKRDFYPALAALDATLHPNLKEQRRLSGDDPPPPSHCGGSFEDDSPEDTFSSQCSGQSDTLKLAEANAKKVKDRSSSKKNKTKKDLKLNQFLSNYTSEDNESFRTDMQKELEEKTRKVFWMEEHEKQAANHLIDQGDPKRTGMLDGWKYSVKNNLYFHPNADGIDQELCVHPGEDKRITYKNTRFPGGFFNAPTKKEKKMHQQALSLSQGTNTPMVNGHKYVRTPSPSPGCGESPFMTWGDIVGTPVHLEEEDNIIPKKKKKSDVKTAHFQVPATPSRDEVLWKLEAQVKKNMRHRLSARRRSPNQRSPYLLSPSPSPKLSPAARKLLRKNSPFMSDLQLRASYSSSPMNYRNKSKNGLRQTPSSLRVSTSRLKSNRNSPFQNPSPRWR